MPEFNLGGMPEYRANNGFGPLIPQVPGGGGPAGQSHVRPPDVFRKKLVSKNRSKNSQWSNRRKLVLGQLSSSSSDEAPTPKPAVKQKMRRNKRPFASRAALLHESDVKDGEKKKRSCSHCGIVELEEEPLTECQSCFLPICPLCDYDSVLWHADYNGRRPPVSDTFNRIIHHFRTAAPVIVPPRVPAEPVNNSTKNTNEDSLAEDGVSTEHPAVNSASSASSSPMDVIVPGVEAGFPLPPFGKGGPPPPPPPEIAMKGELSLKGVEKGRHQLLKGGMPPMGDPYLEELMLVEELMMIEAAAAKGGFPPPDKGGKKGFGGLKGW